MGLKNIREVLGSDALLDVFAFLSRSELDTLQLVNASFDVIIEGKMQLICVRRVARAAMHCRTPGRVFVLTITLEGARKEIRFSTGVIDECAAFVQLLSACRSSRVELLEMYGDTPLTEAHVDAVFRHAPYILMGNFRLGARALPESVSNDSFLQILDSFAEMRKVDIAPDFYTAEMQRFLVRRGFMFQVGFCAKFRGSYDILRWEPKCSVDDETLLHFSFAECDGRWATRWRRLSLSSSDLTPDFLQRWIKVTSVLLLAPLPFQRNCSLTYNSDYLKVYPRRSSCSTKSTTHAFRLVIVLASAGSHAPNGSPVSVGVF